VEIPSADWDLGGAGGKGAGSHGGGEMTSRRGGMPKVRASILTGLSSRVAMVVGGSGQGSAALRAGAFRDWPCIFAWSESFAALDASSGDDAGLLLCNECR